MSARKLIVFGGGPLPYEGLKQFSDWAEAMPPQREILIIAWASDHPVETALRLSHEFNQVGKHTIRESLRPPHTPQAERVFLGALGRAGAVFFSGGDQNKITRVLHASPAIKRALHDAYLAGVAFGGTSAGTAIMSELMIASDEDTGMGLGLIDGVIFDQHFSQRKRHHRLFDLVLRNPHLRGIGVDENVAVAITDSRYAVVLGQAKVTLVEAASAPDELSVKLVKHGFEFDLSEA